MVTIAVLTNYEEIQRKVMFRVTVMGSSFPILQTLWFWCCTKVCIIFIGATFSFTINHIRRDCMAILK